MTLALCPMTRSKAILLAVVPATCVCVLYYMFSSMGVGRTSNTVAWDHILNATMERLRANNGLIRDGQSQLLRTEQKQLRDILLLLGRDLVSSAACKNNDSQKKHRLYIITATYPRPQQLAELTRMSQTLKHVKNMHWLVIEDANTKTQIISELLHRSGISHEHLTAPMPKEYTHMNSCIPLGVFNRLRGLEWIRANVTSGVLYFADDEYTYDLRLFEEIRTTKRVSVWPIGLCSHLGMSSPVVHNGSLIDFYDGFMTDKKFPVHIASFAVNVEFLLQRPKATIPFVKGFEEDMFLKSLAPLEPGDLELKAKNCTEILVWHTQTRQNVHYVSDDLQQYKDTKTLQHYKDTNLKTLYHQYGMKANKSK